MITAPKMVYVDGKWEKWENATVHIATHALHYGTAVFGGIRSYWNEDEKQAYIFRLDDHIWRFFNSSQYFFMSPKETKDDVKQIIIESVRRNEFKQDVYIRPLFYKSENPSIIGVSPVGVKDSLLVFAVGYGEYLPLNRGLNVCISSFQQLSDNSLPRRGKISGAYANSAFASAEAKMRHFDEAILLNRDGMVSEGSAMNVFIVRDGVAITPPVYASLLEGITRKTILEICKDLGIPTQERPIQRSELYISDEAFFCGTGAQVALIEKIDGHILRDAKWTVSKKIRDAYFDIVHGKNKKYSRWLTPLY